MRMNRIILTYCMAVCFTAAGFCAVSENAHADDRDILKRLEKMEREIQKLQQENMELRKTIETQTPEATETLRAMFEADRREIEELKRSAARMDPGSLRTVLGKYDMQIYGRVKVDINYDTADFGAYSDGDWLGAISTGKYKNNSTNFNPRDTRFGLKVARRDNHWLSEAVIETDFYGNNTANNLIPRLRLGYVKITNEDWKASLTVGQDWVPVAQLNPPTIDFGILAAAGNLWWRVPQVTLRKNVGNFEFLVSAMKHRRRLSIEQSATPWTLARIAYSDGILGRGGLLALGGGWQNTKVRNNNGNRDSLDRWMIALELRLQFGKFTFMAEPWIGKGLESEWLRYDMGVNPYHFRPSDRFRDPQAIRSRGGFAALTYTMNPKLNFSVGYGLDNPKKSDMNHMRGQLNNRMFTRNQIVFVNSWYKVTDAVQMGVEFMRVQTERFRDTRTGNRFTFSTAYLF